MVYSICSNNIVSTESVTIWLQMRGGLGKEMWEDSVQCKSRSSGGERGRHITQHKPPGSTYSFSSITFVLAKKIIDEGAKGNKKPNKPVFMLCKKYSRKNTTDLFNTGVVYVEEKQKIKFALLCFHHTIHVFSIVFPFPFFTLRKE